MIVNLDPFELVSIGAAAAGYVIRNEIAINQLCKAIKAKK